MNAFGGPAAQVPGMLGVFGGGVQGAMPPGLAAQAAQAAAQGRGPGGPPPGAGPAGPPPPGLDAIQQQAQQAMAAQMQAAQAAPTQGMAVSQLPQINTGPGAGPPSSVLGDMARLQGQNQMRAAGAPGAGWGMAKAIGLGGMGGGLGGSGLGAGVGAGAAGLMELLRQRKAKQPLKQAKGGLVQEPKRMAMGGVAKVRKNYPNCKGMGKAVKGGNYKGSK